jgi:hypothetical protein
MAVIAGIQEFDPKFLPISEAAKLCNKVLRLKDDIRQRDLSEVSRHEEDISLRPTISRDFRKILLDETALQSMWIVSIWEGRRTN